MNMISTGSFLTEMDASNKQETLAEKFAAVWEKKNAKAARAGGVSLMALSLAACGSSDDDTAATPEPTPTPTPTPTPPASLSFVLKTTADSVMGGEGNDSITGTELTLNTTDVINDVSATDNDTMTITASDDISATPVVLNIENVQVNVVSALSGGDTTFAMSVDNIRANNISVDVTSADSLVAAADINSMNSGSLTVSDEIATVNVAGVNNSVLVVNTSTVATSVTIDGTTEDAVTVNGAGDVTIAASTNDGLLTVDAVGDVAITADTATSVNATAGAGKDVTITSADAATSLVATAGDDITVTSADSVTTATLTAATGLITATGANALTVATSVTATAQEDSAIDADVATAITLTSTGLAGAEVDFTLNANKVDTLTLAGSSAINAIIAAADITTETVVNTNTAGATLTVNAAASADLTEVANSVDIRLGANFGTYTLDAANTGAVFEVDDEVANTGTVTFKADTATSAATNSVTVKTTDSSATAGDDSASVATLAFTDFGTVNIIASGDALAVSADITGDDLTSLKISGDKAVTIANTVTGSSTTNVVVDATNLAAALGITMDATANATETVYGGSKVDTIALDAAAASGNAFTIETNGGNDIVDVNADVDFSYHGGAGNDRLQLADGVNLATQTVTLTSVETIYLEDDADVTLDGSMLHDTIFIIDNADSALNSTESVTVVVDQLTLNLSKLAFSSNVTGDADDVVIMNVSSSGLSFNITGSSNIDQITGGSAGDILNGGGGADTITGGAGLDVITLGAGADNVVLANVANVKATADNVLDFASTDNIVIDATAAGQFGDLHDSDGDAFDGAATGVVATVNIAGGAAALATTNANVIAINADTSDLTVGYASITALQTAVDAAAITEQGGTGAFADTDELVIAWYNTTAAAYEVGIITIAGGNGFDGADETYESLLKIDVNGTLTLAEVAASIDFIG